MHSALLLRLTCLLLLVTYIRSRGLVKIQFLKYENNEGLGANGECCDGKWGICQRNGCDHMFILCLDNPGKANDISRCNFGRVYSRAIKDQNVNTFTNTIANLTNPVSFTITDAFPAELDLKVVVWDHDKGFGTGGDDHVDTLTQSISSQFREQQYVTRHRTRLIFKAIFECASNYYGTRCDKHCPPPSPTSHYRCNLETGDKICLTGWTGNDCQTQAQRPCDPGYCLHGGSCFSEGQTYKCRCTADYTGQRCENAAARPTVAPSACPSGYCQNRGVCFEAHNTPRCVCLDGYAGDRCEIPVRASTEAASTIPTIQKGDTDCDALAKGGFLYMDGVYNIQPRGALTPFPVFCDMTTEGWTVIQRRKTGNVNFNQNWQRYKEGFGEAGPNTDYWIGLEKLHLITTQIPGKYTLKIKFKTYDGRWHGLQYRTFWVDSESNDYKVHVGGYSGNAGDALNNGQAFSASDRDQDAEAANCAQRSQSGWWWSKCDDSNLNGPMLEVNPNLMKPTCGTSPCMTWSALPDYKNTPLLASLMSILPN